MPYIKGADRPAIDIDLRNASVPGELNYAITSLICDYLHFRGESYQTYNEIVGVLDCAKMELYRRKIAPYEDKKIEENGDVY